MLEAVFSLLFDPKLGVGIREEYTDTQTAR
jgi:hypothetical protein